MARQKSLLRVTELFGSFEISPLNSSQVLAFVKEGAVLDDPTAGLSTLRIQFFAGQCKCLQRNHQTLLWLGQLPLEIPSFSLFSKSHLSRCSHLPIPSVLFPLVPQLGKQQVSPIIPRLSHRPLRFLCCYMWGRQNDSERRNELIKLPELPTEVLGLSAALVTTKTTTPKPSLANQGQELKAPPIWELYFLLGDIHPIVNHHTNSCEYQVFWTALLLTDHREDWVFSTNRNLALSETCCSVQPSFTPHHSFHKILLFV